MIKCIVVDDEHDGREALKSQLGKYCPDIEVIGEAHGVECAFELINDLAPELVFLDIRMDDGTGFDLLRRFPRIGFKVIFVSAFDEYAMEAIRYSAIDYLLKPVSPSLLKEAVAKTIEYSRIEKLEEQVSLLLQEKKKRDKIALPTSDGLLFVKIKEIVHCESDNNYTLFYLLSGKKILVTRTLKEYETLLPSEEFFRVHKSHLINLKYVEQFITKDGWQVRLENGNAVPVARNRKDDFLTRIS